MKIIKILILIITITLILTINTTQTKAQDLYCAMPDIYECLLIPTEISNQSCLSQAGVVGSQDVCEIGCCCLQGISRPDNRGQCEYYDGEFIYSSTNDCDNVCAGTPSLPPPTTYNIIINVSHQNDNPQIVIGNYTLFQGQQASYTQVYSGFINNDNQIRITDKDQGTYQLVINSNKTVHGVEYQCTHTGTINLNSNFNENWVINDCQAISEPDPDPDPEPPICVSLWEYEFSDPENYCGQVLNRTDINNCVPSNPPPGYELGHEVPCIELPPETLLCGNNQLDEGEGEECETLNNGLVVYANGMDSCTELGFESGEIQCSPICKVDTTLCSNCPTDPNDCSSFHCDICPICDTNPVCQTPCNQPDSITMTLNRLYQTQAGIKISWEAEACTDNSQITIYKRTCLNEGACANLQNTLFPLFKENLAFNPNFYNDTTFTNSHINIKIFACYILKMSNTTDYIISDPACLRLPDKECIGRPNNYAFCENNAIKKCEDGFITSVEDCGEERCIQPSTGPECVMADICDACSGPFGMFGFMLYKQESFFVQSFNCELAEEFNFCFREDYSSRLTSFGQFNHCADVQSCYNYKTKGSCERDTCSINDYEEECKWNDFSEELGLGVCVPQNPDKQDCKKCDELAPLGSCTQDMCVLFGNDCFYNEDPKRDFIINQFYCNNKYEVGCETYNTQDQCEGGVPLNISVEYADLGEDIFKRTGITNEIFNNSTDSLGRGLCVWVGDNDDGRCIRDADFDTQNYANDDKVSDCDGDKQNINCLLDFEPPITTLSIKGQELGNETYSKTQLLNYLQVQATNATKTFYQITKQGVLYPNLTYSGTSDSLLKKIQNEVTEGEYNLSYYSKDMSKNLEKVNVNTINILPELNVTINHTSTYAYYEGANQVLSNVTITINGTHNAYACRAQLYDSSQNLNIGPELIYQTINGTINWPIYLYRADGTYLFKYHCYDQYEQTITGQYEFVLDADKTLSNPQPIFSTFNTDQVEIQITSISNASCNFTAIGPKGTNVTSGITTVYNEEDGSQTHKANVTTTNRGVYIYRPVCQFDDEEIGEDGNFEGNNGDLIFFGIDNSGPRLIIYDLSQGQNPLIEYNSSANPVEDLYLKFVCDDYEAELHYQGIHYYYGCQENMTYNLTHTNLSAQLNNITMIQENEPLPNGAELELEAPQGYFRVMMNVTTKDLGNNTRSNPIYLRLRDLTSGVPSITICDPQTTTCV